MSLFSLVIHAVLLREALCSFSPLADYEPLTKVTDHAGIAGDQRVIEEFCGIGDAGGITSAFEVYKYGGHSKSYVEIILSQPLVTPIEKGSEMTGVNMNGDIVTGLAMDSYPLGATSVEFQYSTSDSIDEYVKCKVGGLPASEQVTYGCLAPTGTISTTGVSLPYTAADTLNARTIQGFSTNSNIKMKPGDDPAADYFDFFRPYLDYFGESNFDFGDEIARAGFTGEITEFDNGNIDPTGYGFDARCQIAKKTTAYIIVGLYTQRQLYDAFFDCQRVCSVTECNDDAVNSLDVSVAFYVGNQEASDGIGNLAYSLAEKMCRNFGTCKHFNEGQSIVNQQIMTQFNRIKLFVLRGACQAIKNGVDEVVRLMQIPIIQGTLRYAYLNSIMDSPTESMQAEGAIFATAILPKVHQCDLRAAQLIYENLSLKQTGVSNNTAADVDSKTSFEEVKWALESVYACMGIKCDEVGGIIDPADPGNYVQGGGPCRDVGNSGTDEPSQSPVTVVNRNATTTTTITTTKTTTTTTSTSTTETTTTVLRPNRRREAADHEP